MSNYTPDEAYAAGRLAVMQNIYLTPTPEQKRKAILLGDFLAGISNNARGSAPPAMCEAVVTFLENLE